MCNECGNVAAGGLWLPIEWPVDRAEIEAVVETRQTKNQNWLPGQTVEDLRAETRDHGVR